ncbi:unnamed protein product [Urochloa decumbens]|uniref:F-box domain-containing protein n=1 Tax=Urochloa decumbens TaxID=240449 RepID=A0ABC8WIT8_9POAL
MVTAAAGCRGIDALCEDALAAILVRLPSKSVLRCRAVCRSWRRITTDRSFLAAHAARRPLELITLSWAVNAASLSVDGPTTPPRSRLLYRKQMDRDGAPTADLFNLLCSLDGLLLLQQRAGLFVICNPITRQWTNLPPCRHAFACGFYLHGSSGEYRLLCHGIEEEEGSIFDSDRHHYVLSVGGALPRRRRLGRAPLSTFECRVTDYEVPVAHRGTLHWLVVHPEAARTGKMLAFDTDSEAFRLMSRPPERAGDTARVLLELDGELSVAAMQGVASLAVWALQDYGAEIWALRRRVEVPPSTLYGGIYSDVLPTMVVPVGGGAVLIGRRYCDVARLYDLKDERMVREFYFGPDDPTPLVFRESIVSHAFFDCPRSSDVAYIKFFD